MPARGLTRPTANALIAAVGLAALVAIIRRRDGWRPWVAMLLAPAGYVGYLSWVAYHLGRVDGYFYLQREAWGNSFDGGGHTWQSIGHVLTLPSRLALYVVTLVIALALVLLALAVLDRLPWPLLVYSAVTIIVVLGAAGAYHGKARYLVPVFPLLLPVADGLVGARTRTRAVVLLFVTLASAWFGAYLCLDWRSAL